MSKYDFCSAPGCNRPVGDNGAKGMCYMHYSRKRTYVEITHLAQISPFDAGWFIGLFEGEGSISDSGKNSVQLGISMSDEDTIDRAHKVIQMGERYGPYPAPRSDKLIWTVKVCKTIEAHALLVWMLPHLSIRRAVRAEKAILRLLESRNVQIVQSSADVLDMKSLCVDMGDE